MSTRGAAAGIGCLLLLTLTAGGPRTLSARKPGSVANGGLLRLEMYRAANLFAGGRYQEAAGIFRQALREAERMGDRRLQSQLINNLGSCQLATFRHREAVKAFRDAARLAEKLRDDATAGMAWSNLATAYFAMGELEAASTAAERALEFCGRSGKPPAAVLLRAATLRARTVGLQQALPLFEQSAEAAESAADVRTAAQVWRTLGYEYLRHGRLGDAEEVLLHAFRMQRLHRTPDLHLAYRNLALLRMAQGDVASASVLIERALDLARAAGSPVPLWNLHHLRGELHRRQGRLSAALADFRIAVKLARRWRLSALPADAFQISVDVGLQQLYASLIETAAELALRTGAVRFAREAFTAAEENRAASLSAAVLAAGQSPVVRSEEYAEALNELHAAELAALKASGPTARQRLHRARQRIVELELESGLADASEASFDWDVAGRLWQQTQQALRDSEVLLAFHLGPHAGYRWTLTRSGFQLDRVPAKDPIARLAQAFREAVRQGSPQWREAGRRLGAALFGGLASAAHAKPVWLLELDPALFDLPWAAIPLDGPGGGSTLLIERHALQIVPNLSLLTKRGGPQRQGVFLAVGDPIYNTADPRWKSAGDHFASGFGHLLPRLRAADSLSRLELTRLPGSGREIRACAAAWQTRALLLEGEQARWEVLQQALAQRPAVLHLVTHFLPAPETVHEALIAFSLGPDGEPELIGTAAVRGAGRAADLVVLSGCSSGRGPALPGAGLLGLTRAWLAAGARAVVASLWPTPDDSGELFAAFYRRLSRGRADGAWAAARALRAAQREMCSRGDWRAQPGYWAGYFVVGLQ